MINILAKKPHRFPGRLIQFEGTDGCGKSTIIRDFFEQVQRESPGLPLMKTEVPGGTPRMELLLEKLLHGNLTDQERAAILLENHRVLNDEVLIPKLKEGSLIVMSRSLWSYPSYQGFALDLGVKDALEKIRPIAEKLQPDVIVRIVVDPAIAQARLNRRETESGAKKDSFELRKLDFYQRVLMGYEISKSGIQSIMPNTQLIDIKDLAGEMTPEERLAIVWERLLPVVKEWKMEREGKIEGERVMCGFSRERR